MASSDGNYIDSYGHLLINFSFIFTYLVYLKKKIRINTCSLQISEYWNSREIYFPRRNRDRLEVTTSLCHIYLDGICR